MRLVPGSPQPLPLLAVGLALALTALLPHLAMGVTPFPQDLEPISIVGRERECKPVMMQCCSLVQGGMKF